MKVLIFLLFLLLLTSLVLSCGVTTHNVIANKALHWYLSEEDYPEYKTIIENNLGSFQAGAAFPDWGYNCILDPIVKNHRNGSEIAHWLPFQKEMVNHIRTNYKKPWNWKAQRAIAFLMGVVSHSISDIIWHNMGPVGRSGQGFIQALSNSNFNSHGHWFTNEAHLTADTGGEFLAGYEIDLSFIDFVWHLPTEDIINVYKNMGLDYNSITIDTCVAELYSEVQAISRLPSEKLLPIYSAKSPFLIDYYQNWWVGGLNDGAMWTAECWKYTLSWLEHGVTPGFCPVMTDISIRDKNILMDYKANFRKRMKSLVKNLVEKYRPFDNKEIGPKIDPEDPQCIDQKNIATVVKFDGDQKYALYGDSIAVGDLNGDGFDDIIIGMPGINKQRGGVEIIYGSNSTKNLKKNRINYSGGPNSKFGKSVQAIDINIDGFDDLIVGIPTDGTLANMNYSGSIWIYFGSKNGIGKGSGIDSEPLGKSPDLKFTSGHNYTSWGSILNKGDIDGDGYDDLIIGDPYVDKGTGAIFIVLANKTTTGIQVFPYMVSEDIWSWFGYKSKVIRYHGFRYLLTSQPMFNNNSTSVGRLLCYDIDNHKIVWEIVGMESNGRNGRLGFSFDIWDDKLMLSAPTVTNGYELQFGKVYIVSLGQLFNGDRTRYNLDQLDVKYSFGGNNYYSRLGWDVGFANFTGTSASASMYFSEPYYGNNNRGAVHLVYGNKRSCFTSNAEQSLYGKKVLSLDFNNDSKLDLLISAPRAKIHFDNGGTVSLLLGPLIIS